MVRRIVNKLLYVVDNSLYPLGKVIGFISPYVIIVYILKYGYNNILLLLPIIFSICSILLIELSNQKGKGNLPPIPNSRFTQSDGEGEISVDRDRLQELILFTYDYEEWLRRNGYSNI